MCWTYILFYTRSSCLQKAVDKVADEIMRWRGSIEGVELHISHEQNDADVGTENTLEVGLIPVSVYNTSGRPHHEWRRISFPETCGRVIYLFDIDDLPQLLKQAHGETELVVVNGPASSLLSFSVTSHIHARAGGYSLSFERLDCACQMDFLYRLDMCSAEGATGVGARLQTIASCRRLSKLVFELHRKNNIVHAPDFNDAGVVVLYCNLILAAIPAYLMELCNSLADRLV